MPPAPPLPPAPPAPIAAAAPLAPPVPPAMRCAKDLGADHAAIRREVDAAMRQASIERDRALREVPAQVRLALRDARASIANARGIADVERREALGAIDKAMADLDTRREPVMQ